MAILVVVFVVFLVLVLMGFSMEFAFGLVKLVFLIGLLYACTALTG